MTVSEGPGGSGTRIIATRYPVEEGLTAGTTKTSEKKIQLEAEERSLPPIEEYD